MALWHCHAFGGRRRATSSSVVGLRHVISLDDLLHLKIVLLSLDESVLKDRKRLFFDVVVDCSEVGCNGETFGMC